MRDHAVAIVNVAFHVACINECVDALYTIRREATVWR